MAFNELVGGDVSQVIADQLGASPTLITTILIIIIIWELAWTGLACWKSARKSNPIWFILFLVLNTVGILEILYIFVFSELGKPSKPSKPKKPKPVKKSGKVKAKKSKPRKSKKK